MDIKRSIDLLRQIDKYIPIILTRGGCYRFYQFLNSLFPDAKPYINNDKDHIVTLIGDTFYDINGVADGEFHPLSIEDEEMCEEWNFSSKYFLSIECPHCGEMLERQYD